MDSTFFDQLQTFLPQYISPFPSYAHAAVACVVAGMVTHLLAKAYLVFDIDGDGRVSETEERAQRYVRVAVSTIVSLFVADAVFSVSYRTRGFQVNRKHLTYRRWFPQIYSSS